MKRLLESKDKFYIKSTAARTEVSGLPGVKKQLCLHTITFTVCALLLVFVSGFVIHASGLNMWHLFVTWDNETMHMREEKNGWKMRQEYENDMNPVFDDAFFQKMKEMEMYPLLPSWMPDGFVLGRVENKIETEYYRWALGAYTYGERQFNISVVKNISENSGGVWCIEKDERKPDIYEQGGIKFYIMDNLSRSHAFWIDPPYTVSIAGHVTRDELKQMITSMFERK